MLLSKKLESLEAIGPGRRQARTIESHKASAIKAFKPSGLPASQQKVKGKRIMTKIIPLDQQDRQQWKQHNAEVLEEVQDQALKSMIEQVLHLHDIEHSGKWRQAHRRLDFSKSTFADYLQLYARWSIPEFRILEEAVFENFDELKRKGLYSVLIRLRKEKDHK